MVAFLDLCLFASASEVDVEVEEVYLHPGGAVTIERWTDPTSSEVATVATLVEVGSDGIQLIRYLPTVQALAGVGGDRTARRPDRSDQSAG
jgi:hypothetical protein